jgi:membrane protease YdiL (CAAX protease family)
VVIFAPLFEEWLCRKVALGGLLRKGFSPAAAIFWSALMFGVIHMNPWQAIPGFLMGLLFGWIYWRTRSLWSVIFMHAVNNGAAMLFTVLFPELPDDVTTLDIVGVANYPWILITAIVLTLSLIWILHKYLAHPSK